MKASNNKTLEYRVRVSMLLHEDETKERSEKKEKWPFHYFRAAPSFRTDIANARINSSSSTGNVRKYSDRHIKGNFLVVLPLISRVYINHILIVDKGG